MSEFQYFEFKALERPLTKEEQGILRTFSTRARISARSFINEYHWGNFKGDKLGWMKKYFDAHLYLSNFGSRALHLRVPLSLVDLINIRPYEVDEVLEAHETARHLVLSFYSDEDSGRDYDEHDEDPSEVMDSLLPIRDEIARGDLRALYIVWLLAVRNGLVDEKEIEPPVPDGLGELSAALESFVSFLWLKPEIVEVASLNSGSLLTSAPSGVTAMSWVDSLSPDEKDDWLVRLLADEEGIATIQYQQAFKHAVLAARLSNGRCATSSSIPRRSAGELLKEANILVERKDQAAKRRGAEEQETKIRKEAVERLAYLKSLVGQEDNVWKSIIALTATSTPANYDSGVKKLVELRDIAALTGEQTAFGKRLAEFRSLRSRKLSFIKRLDGAGL